MEFPWSFAIELFGLGFAILSLVIVSLVTFKTLPKKSERLRKVKLAKEEKSE